MSPMKTIVRIAPMSNISPVIPNIPTPVLFAIRTKRLSQEDSCDD